MTKSECVLLDLIRESLFGIAGDYPENTNWDDILFEANVQAVIGIVSDKIPIKNKTEWDKRKDRNDANYIKNLYGQEQLINLFLSNGIPLAILKGAAAAVYYPVPSQRTMGDVDFIVQEKRFEEARTILIESGYSCFYGNKGTVNREAIFFKDGQEYELHYHFSDPDLDVEQYITEGLKEAVLKRIDDFEFPMLPKLANGIVLLAHMRHHLQDGMGLRQVIDWMMYVDNELDDEYWENTFSKVAEEIGLDRLAIVVTKICQEYLGLTRKITWCQEADLDSCNALLDIILTSGNFGYKNGQGHQIEKVTMNIRKEGFFGYLQKAGETNWKAYHKHPWLKPVCWLYQIMRYIRQGIRTKRGKEMINDLNRSKERYKLLKDLNIL